MRHRKTPPAPIAGPPSQSSRTRQLHPPLRCSATSRSPLRKPRTSSCLNCTCSVSRNLLLLHHSRSSDAGYHRDLARKTEKQHESVVIPGNTRRQRRLSSGRTQESGAFETQLSKADHRRTATTEKRRRRCQARPAKRKAGASRLNTYIHHYTLLPYILHQPCGSPM